MLSTNRLAITLLWGIIAITAFGCASTDSKSKHAPAQQAESVKVPETVEADYNKAIQLIEQKKHADAQPLLISLTKSHPTLAGPWVNLGIIYTSQQNYPEALLALQKAVELKPSTSDAHVLLALSQRQTGQFKDAEATLTDGLQRFPNDASIKYNLAILYDLYMNQPAQAIAHYEGYQKLQKEPDAKVAGWLEVLQNSQNKETE